MIFFFYNIGIQLFNIGLSVLGVFKPHIKDWNRLRKEDLNKLVIRTDLEVLWVHCASLGEYEQIRPLLAAIQEDNTPKYYVFLTFFSPSGYNVIANKALADQVAYLPIDSKRNMHKMVATVNPQKFIGVKYEFWWNLLAELKNNGTKIIYTNVVISDGHFVLKPAFNKFKEILQSFDKIFVQDRGTLGLLRSKGFTNLKQNGDMRVDNVIDRVKSLKPKFDRQGSKKIFVWGSIYIEEIAMINSVINSSPHYKHIIVPHHVDHNNIEKIKAKLQTPFVIDRLKDDVAVTLITTVGELFGLYKIADLAYVGGGMNGGLHNILEPTATRLPTVIGPIHQKFPEAEQLIALGITKEASNASEIQEFIDYYTSLERLARTQIAIDQYIEDNKGATKILTKYIGL